MFSGGGGFATLYMACFQTTFSVQSLKVMCVFLTSQNYY